MRRRRRLPPDTRPKWDDPDLGCNYGMWRNGYPASEMQMDCIKRLKQYDRQPRDIRDLWKYSRDNDLSGPGDDCPH